MANRLAFMNNNSIQAHGRDVKNTLRDREMREGDRKRDKTD